MGQFKRTQAAIAAVNPRNTCTCGNHFSGLECRAQDELEALGATVVFEDVIDDYAGLLIDYHVLDAPSWLCLPAYVEIKPPELIQSVMEALNITANLLRREGPRHTFQPAPSGWLDANTDNELGKIQKFINHRWDDGFGVKTEVLVTSVINADIDVALILGPERMDITHQHPAVSTGEARRRTLRKDKQRDLYLLVNRRYRKHRANDYPGECEFCGRKMAAKDGYRSDLPVDVPYSFKKQWPLICSPCYGAAWRS